MARLHAVGLVLVLACSMLATAQGRAVTDIAANFTGAEANAALMHVVAHPDEVRNWLDQVKLPNLVQLKNWVSAFPPASAQQPQAAPPQQGPNGQGPPNNGQGPPNNGQAPPNNGQGPPGQQPPGQVQSFAEQQPAQPQAQAEQGPPQPQGPPQNAAQQGPPQDAGPQGPPGTSTQP